MKRHTAAGRNRTKKLHGVAKPRRVDKVLRKSDIAAGSQQSQLDQALEREAATAEVLRVIAGSRGDLGPVFNAILRNAMHICDAKFGTLFRYDGKLAYTVAGIGTPAKLTEFQSKRGPFKPDPAGTFARCLYTKAVVHSTDELAAPKPGVAAIYGGARSTLYVPLIRDDEATGQIVIYRQEVKPFTDKQIELVQNFAAQAVIAIENARLLNELRQRTDDLSEALEQQTATSDVLKVISSSPGELAPVFEAILNNATRLSEAKFGILLLGEQGGFRTVALHNAPQAFADYRQRDPMLYPAPETALGHLLATRQVEHIPDMREHQGYLDRRQGPVSLVELAGARTVINVPMLKDNELIGCISFYRQEVRPFTERQIELVKNFAAQAVIAIENARLLGELRQRTDDLAESLEQQTATSEVLKVISSSPGELEPVFNAMLENATRICEAKFGILFLSHGDGFLTAAMHNAPPALVEARRSEPIFRPPPHTALSHTVQTKRTTHIGDILAEPGYFDAIKGYSQPRIGLLADARTVVSVPMLKDEELVGAIVIYRQEVRPFTDKQIDLVSNFASQAVIAIENTRLLTELRQRTDDLSEALEQQTATTEVLEVISSSPGDLKPVFEAMLENAVRICGAKFGTLFRFDGEKFHTSAFVGAPQDYIDYQEKRGAFVPPPGAPLLQLMRTKDVVRTLDMSTQTTPVAEFVQFAGTRSHVAVPMLREGELTGAIVIYNQEVQPFTDKQVELVQNFAAQAVIAIENARLLNELRESLEQQTATADVLKVISRSAFDLQTVLQTLVESAARLCRADRSSIRLLREGRYHHLASHGYPAEHTAYMRNNPITPSPESVVGRVVLESKVIHITDFQKEPGLTYLQAPGVEWVGAGLGVPLLREGKPIGTLLLMKTTTEPFAAKQIELATTFADQAVIAIENARLLNELRESLEQQTATADVLKVISRSTFDLQAVLDTLTESAARLCRADRSAIRLLKDDLYHNAASYGFAPDHRERMAREPVKAGPDSIAGRVAAEKKSIHLIDAQTDPNPAIARRSRSGAVHTMLAVPLLRQGTPIGALLLQRGVVNPFTDKQIELAETFADQAVIAIENVRLFDEVQKRTDDLAESLQQQTATADVLKVISRFAFDLQPVFNTMAESAVKLCEAERAYIFRFDGNLLRAVASFNAGPENQDWVRRNPISLGRHSVSARAGLDRRTVQVVDVQSDPEYNYVSRDVDPIRTTVAVPMLKGDELIGTITIYRLEVKPFTEKQIALMETFADQAVIAIENVRLFDEIQDKSRQLAEASQHKSQFLANMSHELRTPLNAILGYTELITDGVYGQPSDKMLTVLKRLESNGKHLLGLINDVLDLSKIEAGQLVLNLGDYSLKDVAYTVYSAVEPLAADKKLAFKAEVAPDMPKGHGDERRLTQVLLNLVGNAIKFTDAGEVVIKAGASNGSFNLSVHDTGPGISAADQDKLFQEFQQADNSITRKKGGTGLGLAISKRIVEMHGGKIWLESTVGQGSTFFVTLPVQARPKPS